MLHENGQICISDEAISIERASVLHSLVAAMQGIKEPTLSPELVVYAGRQKMTVAYQIERKASCQRSLVLRLYVPSLKKPYGCSSVDVGGPIKTATSDAC